MITPSDRTTHQEPGNAELGKINAPRLTEAELFVDAHLQAAMGEMRAAARIALVYYGDNPNNPVASALENLTAEYNRFLTQVSARHINDAAAQHKAVP